MRAFIYWARTVRNWSHYSNKKLQRDQLRYWLDVKPCYHVMNAY